MQRDLSRTIDEIEERLTAWRFRAGSADISAAAMLDELAQLLSDARQRLDRPTLAGGAADGKPTSLHDDRGDVAEGWTELLYEPYIVTDRYGTIRSANSALYELIGLPPYFMLGRPITMFLEAEHRLGVRALISRLRTSERETVTVAWRRYAGEPVRGTLSAMASYDGGEVSAIRWIAQPEHETEEGGAPAAPPLPGDRSNLRTSFLTTVSGILARSLDHQLTLEALAALSVPLLGDWCLVDMLDEEGQLRRVAAAGAPAEPQEYLAALRERRPVTPPERALATESIRTARGAIMRASLFGFPGNVALSADEHDAYRRLAVTSALVVPLRARGQVLGVITFLMCRSRRRHGDADLALAEELGTRAGILADNARLYRAAQQASKAKSDFLAAMSHELRTPLTAVIGYTEILADEIVGPLTSLQKEQLARIRASSEHLVVLVDEVLTYARLEAGHEELVREEVDVHDVVDQAITIVAVQAKVRQLQLATQLPEEPLRLMSDRAKLRQILVNLLANAVKFTRKGTVGVRAVRENGWVSLVVWDTGIGIAPEHLEHIFAPFWQVDQQTTRSFGGSGLGLAVVRRLARLLGGDVTVQSVVGEGSEFTVRLPLTEPLPRRQEISSSDRTAGGRLDPS